MDASTKKTLIWVGALTLGVAAVGGVAYAATHKATSTPATPSTPVVPGTTPTPTPALPGTLATTWSPGTSYVLTSQIPSGITSSDQLISLLQQNGWQNVAILWYGPTGSQVSGATIPFSTTPTTYVAAGTWNGSAATPVPAGVQSYLVGQTAPPLGSITLSPGANSATVKTGTVLTLVLPANAAWVSLTTPGGQSLSVTGTVPAQVTINVTGVLTAIYTDSTGAQRTATVNVTAS